MDKMRTLWMNYSAIVNDDAHEERKCELLGCGKKEMVETWKDCKTSENNN